MKRFSFLACLPVFLILTGCSEEPKKAAEAAKEPEKAAEPVSALTAVTSMFPKARTWSPDCKLVRVANMNLKELPGANGKFAAWEATFVSESRGRSRRYTYSVIDVPPSSISKGVFAGPEDSWSAGGQARPFLIQAFKTDAPAAYETAVKKGGDEYAKKHPDLPVMFLLEATARFPNPAWRVIWGESVSTSNFSVFVDASTGEFLRVAR